MDRERARRTGARPSQKVRLFDDPDLRWRGRPTPPTISAFDVREDPLRRLAGGAGYNWSDERVVLKPIGCVPEHNRAQPVA